MRLKAFSNYFLKHFQSGDNNFAKQKEFALYPTACCKEALSSSEATVTLMFSN